jgi:hypothetical protein
MQTCSGDITCPECMNVWKDQGLRYVDGVRIAKGVNGSDNELSLLLHGRTRTREPKLSIGTPNHKQRGKGADGAVTSETEGEQEV